MKTEKEERNKTKDKTNLERKLQKIKNGMERQQREKER